jgi:predicted RecB family endonuclease
VGRSEAYEAFYGVTGIRQANVSGKLLVARPLDANRIWDTP